MVACTSCKNKSNHFEIKGKIVNAKGHKLTLKQLEIGNQNPVLIDTGIINKDGSFDLKTFMPFDQALFVLGIENGPDVYLINDAEQINLNIDLDSYKQYKVEGSPASEQLHTFLDYYSNEYKSLIEKMKLYDSIQQSEANDSIVLIYKLAKDAALQTINEMVTYNIKHTDNPALKSYLLAKSFATMDKETIAKEIGISKVEFKNYAPINFLEKVIKQQLKTSTPPYPLLGKDAPSFIMEDNYKKVFYLDSLKNKGKYILLNFWTSYSKPCRDENENLVRAYKWYRNRDLTIVSVSLDSSFHAWMFAVDNDNLYWQNVHDPRQFESPAAQKYKIDSLPFNVLIDTTGKIIAADLRGRDLTMKLYEVLPRQ